MESGLEQQINEFLEKFSAQSTARAVDDDDFIFSGNDGSLIRTRSKFDMEFDGLEITGDDN